VYNPGPLVDPTAYAVGYSLAALRASGSGQRRGVGPWSGGFTPGYSCPAPAGL